MQKELTPGRPVGRFANLYQEIVQANGGHQAPEQDPAAWLRAKAGRPPRQPRKFKKRHTLLQGRRNRDRRPRATGILVLHDINLEQQAVDRLARTIEVQHRTGAPILVSGPQRPAFLELRRVRVVRIIHQLKNR